MSEANVIRELREAQRLSQDELARRAGVNQSTITRAERGYAKLRPETRARIYAALLEGAPETSNKEGA